MDCAAFLRCVILPGATTVAVVLDAGYCFAQTTSEAETIVSQSTEFTKSVKTLYAEMVSTTTVNEIINPVRIQMWIQTPDRQVTRYYSSGNTAYYLNESERIDYYQSSNQYTRSKVQPGQAAKHIREGLLAAITKGGSTSGTKVMLVAKETTAGIACNHLKLEIVPDTVTDLWLADSGEPLPVFSRITTAVPPQIIETSYHWIVNKPIPPETFVFTPPSGAKGFSFSEAPAIR